jgi:ATP phosphoribosyltransferase regulatory subunit
MNPRWSLPEYFEDALPDEAMRIELLRRSALDLMFAHGYELVIPPLIEYLDSLLTGMGRDLDLRTFKLVDQLSGRMLGLRADTTPQAARIDAHLLNREGVTRLCYAGHVVHALPAPGGEAREAIQCGVELYGHAGIESDVEVQRLMVEVLRLAHVPRIQVDLGHVGIFRSLTRRARISGEQQETLFAALQAKDIPGIKELLRGVRKPIRESLIALPTLYGDAHVLAEARKVLAPLSEVGSALKSLIALGRALAQVADAVHYDLGELRGYRYHSGAVFAAYAPGHPVALARGGRYDDVGHAFGRARAATGFSLDLRMVASQCPGSPRRRILAPFARDAALARLVAGLRARGNTVVVDLPGHRRSRRELACEYVIAKRGGRWRLRAIS